MLEQSGGCCAQDTVTGTFALSSILGYHNGSTKFQLNPTYNQKLIIIEDFQDGSQCGLLGHHNKMILAILNLHVSPMPPTKFWLNPTYHSGVNVVWRFWRWWPSWIVVENNFSNSKYLCHSHGGQWSFGSIQLTVWEMSFEEFKMRPSWILEWNNFSNSEFPCLPNASHQVLT